MTRKLALNGKYLRAEATGVHRVADELANALAALIAEDHPATRNLAAEVIVPPDGRARAAALALPQRIASGPVGNVWEQLVLPRAAGDALLLSLCNIGPVLRRHAVTMIHDAQVHLTPASYRPAFRWWYRAIQPAFARRHHRILTVSDYSRREIARAGICPIDKIGVVHNGADHIARVMPDPGFVARLALPERRARYVVSFATTQAHKNVARLLAAFADPALADLTLVLVGDTPQAEFGLPVPANVFFTGRIDDAALRALLEGAVCLAFPSTTEGFGLPPLEAMWLGCPAIVAPCGALPEVCGDAALRAAPKDTAAWIAAIRALADDEEVHADWSAQGARHARRFTWRASVLQMLHEIETFL